MKAKNPINTASKQIEEIKPDKLLRGLIITGLIIFAMILMTSLAFIIRLFWKVNTMELDQILIILMYALGSGWLLFLPALPILIIARKQIWNKLRYFGRRARMAKFRFIGADANEDEIIMRFKGNVLDYKNKKFIVNPRKATISDGLKVFTYIADNSLSHDYFRNKDETIRVLADRLSRTKADDLHDVFTDPTRIDAKLFSETFIVAQQTNPDLLQKLIKFFTSKNVITIMIGIALAAGLAALFSFLSFDTLNQIADQFGATIKIV